MVADPKRKTRLPSCLMLGIVGAFLAGCASREPVTAPTPVEVPPPIVKQVRPVSPAPPPIVVPGTSKPRNLRIEAIPEKMPEEWIYRKPGPTRTPLSLFEESSLLGQVRSRLKTMPEAAKVQTIKVQNREVWLGVTSDLTGASAARIGDTLLKESRVDEVRIQPLK